eukprot:CAMPEP_0198129592 /NCGR_PEP_ID=MMETSP1442-20131203/52086_1 /TAXON_ID= /ORGANISM="Craspedostauros australis, Strain CCMP3328" /LENGTH=88 /DNA_ID=CAMNT_0043790015 /DNA_START=5 /DNA_END=271 /DNA_ORIENTATION=+
MSRIALLPIQSDLAQALLHRLLVHSLSASMVSPAFLAGIHLRVLAGALHGDRRSYRSGSWHLMPSMEVTPVCAVPFCASSAINVRNPS